MRELIQQRWGELSPLLDVALDIDPAERERWLIDSCGDIELRDCLRVLLADSDRDSVIDTGSGRIAKALMADDGSMDDDAVARLPNLIGRRLGAYRIGRLIGEGGMASVFLGERDDGGFTQQVAVKVLRDGMLDPREQQQFRRERQILARLEHPNIARLIDGGLTPEGVPWFAMEYVEGTSILAHCDARQLDIDARLALFLQVCDAVAYAHRALVVHRDLKPSNILVADDGALKLLDFGIARLIDPDDTPGEHATVTIASQRRLTPAYAAPEQLRGELVTTSADVYALGVLLHELLTGAKPSRRDDASVKLPSAQAAIVAQSEHLAQQRGRLSARQLRHRIAGDLDMILLTALRAEPDRRYPSVTALADDIRRHRQQRPVRARPESLRYRAGRFVRRNRVGVIAAMLVLASMFAGVAATLRQAAQAREAAARAQHEADRAVSVKRFLLGLFEGAAPNQTQGRAVTASELLDRGAHGLRDGMADAPDLRAELQVTLAGIYRELGQYDAALSLVDPAEFPALAGDAGAQAERGRIAYAQGRLDDAEATLRSALETMPAPTNPATRGARAERLVLLGEVLAARDRKDEADVVVREAIALDRQDNTVAPLALARDQALLGQIAFGRGDLDGADRAMRESLVLRSRELGTTHTLVATTQHDLAVIALQQGDVETARTLFAEALSTRRQLLGPMHADIASTLLNLGALNRRLGDRAAAHAHYTEAATMLRTLFPDGHPELGVAYNSLAVLAQEQGDLAGAANYMDDAVALSRASLGDDHPNIGVMLGNLASILRAQGELDRAETIQREAAELLARAVGTDHHLYGVAINGLGFIELERGNDTGARASFERAAAIIGRALGETHPDFGAVLTGLSEAQLRLGDAAAALDNAQRASRIVADALPDGHPRQRRTRLAHADALAATGDCAAAREAIAPLTAKPSTAETARIDRLSGECGSH
jgi:serine/threonine protein kinase/tetratricopeptide (TPR) repeat protein